MAFTKLQPLTDPEDMFADTRMSFGDHIEDLRWHLWRALIGFVIVVLVCLAPPIGPWAVKFITAPVEQQLKEYYDRFYATRYEALMAEEARNVRPVPMLMYVHVPSLKKVMDGKKADPNADAIIEGVDQVLREIGIEPDAGEDRSKDPNWAPLRVEIPDPIGLAKRMTDIHRTVRPETLSSFNVQEVFIVYVKVALMVGFVFSSPWVFYQLWSFVAAGLYPHEKRLVNHYLPVSIGLFLAGFFVCEFLALPKAIEALLMFNEWLGYQPELRLSEWLGFAIIMPIIFGLSFQTPLVMLFMFKIGVGSIESYRGMRRMSYFLMALFAAVITPSTDIPTMMLLWVPMCLLYEVGIWLCKLQPKSVADEMDSSDIDEMVGV